MSNPFYLHPDLSHLEADDPRAAVLVAAGAAVAGAATWGAEHAAERAAELRAELVALDGFHPVKRRRIAAELAALDAMAELVDLDDYADWLNQSRAAEWLGLNRNTLRKKLVEHKMLKP